jgi:hypothetical protein
LVGRCHQPRHGAAAGNRAVHARFRRRNEAGVPSLLAPARPMGFTPGEYAELLGSTLATGISSGRDGHSACVSSSMRSIRCSPTRRGRFSSVACRATV